MARAPLTDRLRHILEAAVRIEAQTAGKSWDAYVANGATRDVVERNLERISEASRHIPDDLKARHPRIGWRLVADLGNVLRHAYDQAVDERIWQIVTSDLASLKAAVETMLRELEEAAPDRADSRRIVSGRGEARARWDRVWRKGFSPAQSDRVERTRAHTLR